MSLPLQVIDEYEKKEKCGLFGIWGTPEASQITYQGMFAQQHRGQESAGIAVSDGSDSQRPYRHGAGQPGLHSADAPGGIGRSRRHRARAVFHDRIEQALQRPAAVAGISSWARWRWPTTAI